MRVSTKHFRAHILRVDDEIEVSIGPIWDSASRYELPLRLSESRLEESIEDIIEDFRELMLKVKSQLLASTRVQSQSISIDANKSESSTIDGDEER